jgi:tetratricopeptide (TPR) repeat protein
MMLWLVVILTLVGSPEDQAQKYLERARAALASGRLAEAHTSLGEALATDPQNTDALQAAALVALDTGDAELAVEYLEKLLTLDPNNDLARLALARALWLAHQRQRATGVLDTVLERHPTYLPALSLAEDLRTLEEPPSLSRWRPRARVGLALIADSNLSLDPGLVPAVQNRRATLLSVHAGTLVEYHGGPLPLVAFARLDASAPLTKQQQLGDLCPTLVSAGVVGRLPLALLETVIDLRYEELFTSYFDNHLQRALIPSVWLAFRLSAAHQLRLLFGADFRLPEKSFAPASNTTLRAGLRDTMTLDRITLLVEVTGRYNTGGAQQVAKSVVRTDFAEVGGTLVGEYAFSETLGAFLLASGQGREFDAGPRESTYSAVAGGLWRLGFAELHAEYSFSKNLSRRDRSYDRHQMSVGVRAHYE